MCSSRARYDCLRTCKILKRMDWRCDCRCIRQQHHLRTSLVFFFSSRRRHTRFKCDWSSDVCSSDLSGSTPTVIYGLIQWVVVGVLPDPGHSDRPLADVARIAMGHGGGVLIAMGALFSIYGYLSGNMLATPRITFALAERGDFPSVFSIVHPRFRTPYISIFVFAVLVWLLAWFGSFAGNATLSAGSRLFYYGVICAALPVLRRKQKTRAVFQLRGGTLIAIVGVLICTALLTRIEYRKSILLVVAVLVAVLNLLLVRNRATRLETGKLTP